MKTGETLRGRISADVYPSLELAALTVCACLCYRRNGAYLQRYDQGWYAGKIDVCILIVRCGIKRLTPQDRRRLGEAMRNYLHTWHPQTDHHMALAKG